MSQQQQVFLCAPICKIVDFLPIRILINVGNQAADVGGDVHNLYSKVLSMSLNAVTGSEPTIRWCSAVEYKSRESDS